MTEPVKRSSETPSIGEEQIALLEKLSNAVAVSGDEGEVRSIVIEEVKPYADELKVDALGNVLVTCKAGVENPVRVMIAAHMDEVGFMLVNKDDNGMFTFDAVGGLDPRQLAGKPVWVGKKHTPGVIGAKPIHMTTREERERTISIDSLRIDLGNGGGDLAKVGDWATFATTFLRLGHSVRGKALDDRLGVVTLIELVKHAPANIELLAAFTVQEEVGLRGARVAAYAMDPDAAFVIDSTPANDLPTWDQSENEHYNTRLGDGPAIYVADGHTLGDPRLVRYLLELCERRNIPVQLRQPGPGGTDAGAIHKARTGIPTVSVSVPGRYAHTAMGIARIEDWQNTLALLHATLAEWTPDVLAGER